MNNIFFFQSHIVPLWLCVETLFGDVFISLNWGSLYLWDMSQVTLPSSQWRALLPELALPGWAPPRPACDEARRGGRQKLRSVTLTTWYPFLSRVWPRRALKLLDKMKFLDYQWISITVFVLPRPLLLSVAGSWRYCWDLRGSFTGELHPARGSHHQHFPIVFKSGF